MIKQSALQNFALSWSRISTLPMAILGVLYLILYSVQVVNLDNIVIYGYLEYLSTAIWIIFAIDLVIRFISRESIGTFLKANWLEIAAVVIPFLRMLRVFRVLVAIRGLKPYVQSRLAATGAYLFMLIPLAWFIGAISVLEAEHSNPRASITDLPNALWWSLATITTVGYGELYPGTLEGKVVAAILMISGIALFSAGAGMFASWIMGDRSKS